jgi:hypothetical protein
MSSPPQGRALTFPIAWSPSQELSAPAPKAAGDRSPSDEEVMARLQSNDSAALEILFGRYARLVLAIARGIVRDSGEAEDVLQEAFFYLYKKSLLFDGSKGSIGLFKLRFTGHWTGSPT